MNSRLILRIIILLVLIAGVAIAVLQTFGKDAPKTPEEGDLAPNFQLKTLEGETVQLKDFRGKGVLLNFWGYWCKPCKEEMPALDKVYQDFKNKENVAIIAVHIGPAGLPVDNFLQDYPVHFPILVDKQREVTQAYNIGPIPTTFFIGPDGKIKKKAIGGPMKEAYIRNHLLSVMP